MRRKARRLTAAFLSSSLDFWGRIHAKAAGEIRLRTNEVYNRISWETPKRAPDFLRSSLSHYRRNDIDAALSELEAGLEVYPDSGRLLATHLRICCEHDRLVRVTDLINPTKRQLCKTLASLDVVDFGTDLQSIDKCQDHGPVRLTQGIISKNFDDDVLKHWHLADLMEHAGKVGITREIYRRLVRRPLCQPDDFLYAGVSEIRLGNTNGGFKTLASGLAKYPDSESLQSVYRDSCYAQLDFDKYLQLHTIRGKEEVEPSRLALNFYRQAFRLNPPETFIVKFRDVRFNCDDDDFLVLQDEFLAQLRDSEENIDKAKYWILLSKLLGLNDDFCQRLYLDLHSRDWQGGDENSKHVLTLIYKLTLPLAHNYEFDAEEIVRQFMLDAGELAAQPLELSEPIADFGKHWAVWSSLFCLVQPRLYRHAISALEKVAFKLWPRLDYIAPHIQVPFSLQVTAKQKIRIGFTVLDLMPMMSGLVERLDKDIFETVFLRAGGSGGSQTANDWTARAGETVEYSDTNAYSAIETIAEQKLDILISGPCVPQIFFPLMARLAHLHMVLLEPNWPDGIKNHDYYISWQLAEPENYKEFYKTPVSLLRNPPYWIEKPSASEGLAISARTGDDIRHGRLGLGSTDRLYICANTPPKIHTQMDEMFCKLLEKDPAGYLVLLRGEHAPAHLLRARLREKMGLSFERVIFLNTLEKNDAHSLLMAADCCIDSYPICGMSSSFDGIRLGVPIVTLPADIPFGRWTAAIYEYLGVSGLTATDVDDYIRIAMRLAMDKAWRSEKSAELREKSSRYVENKASFDEFQHFIVQAWRRKQAGLPPTSWVAGEWQ